jgi:uncharacterized Zn ribbon protein
LSNILIFAEVEILKPAVQEYVTKRESQKDEGGSREVQTDMETFFKYYKEYSSFISTESTDVVATRNYIRYSIYGTTGLPVRGKLSTEPGVYPLQSGKIYAFEDKDVYICGQCGNQWARKKYNPPEEPREPRQQPQYTKPEPAGSKSREKKHGFGFTFVIRPFGSDPRRTRIVGTTIEINSAHEDYKKLKRVTGVFPKRVLKIYERQQALQAIIEHESKNMTKEEVIEKLREGDSLVLVWYNIVRHENQETTKAEGSSSSETSASAPSQYTVEDLKKKFIKEA